MKTQKIPWRSIETAKARRDGPTFGPQILGGIFILLALFIIYHGVESRNLMKAVDQTLAGTSSPAAVSQVSPPASSQAPSSQASSMPNISTIQQKLQILPAQVQGGQWTEAAGSLKTIEQDWLAVQEKLGTAGVKPADLNGFTADLAQIQLAIDSHDGKTALTDITNANKSMEWMVTTYLGGVSPTFQQISSLVQDLNKQIAAKNWAVASKDAQALQAIVSQVSKGF